LNLSDTEGETEDEELIGEEETDLDNGEGTPDEFFCE